MINESDYKLLFSSESSGQYDEHGIKVLVAAPSVPDLMNHDAVRDVAYKVGDLLKAALGSASIASSPEAKEQSRIEREELLALFDTPIYVEEIPNGYCPDWCCKHLPWFVVTTKIGRITIGWRKRVISIDWTGSMATKKANELFPSDDVTKLGCSIHAWSVANAKRYITAVIDSVEQGK